MVKLSIDIAKAIEAADGTPIPVEIPGTDRKYCLVDADMLHQALEALEFQRNVAAIQTGVDQMEAGLGRPVDEAMNDVRRRLIEKYGDG